MTYTRKSKRPKAIWTQAFPEQVRQSTKAATRPAKARKPVRRRSKATEARMECYRKAKEAFMARPKNQRCAVYPHLNAEDIHHIRGRAGNLLRDERFWLAVSRRGHEWIHANMNAARERGWLAHIGEWNKPPVHPDNEIV